MDPRPNILFICVDQWRADCLGFTGHPTVETPHLDRLARDSTHFSQAYSATPTCVPARAALLTGLAPRQQDADYIDTGIGCNGYVARPWVYDEMLHPTSWVTTQGIDFFRRRDPRKPFFLMLSYHRPHPPLDPPVAYLERYLNKDLPETLCGDWVDFGLPPGGHDSPVPHDQAQIDYARRAYYAQLTHIDHQINRVIMGLFENGLLDNTAIVFTADHGEMLYDHHQIAKGVPFDSSARLPFLLRLPKSYGDEYAPGSTDAGPIELRDLSAEQEQKLAFWRQRLVEELQGREEGFVEDGQLVIGCKQSPTLSQAGTYQTR